MGWVGISWALSAVMAYILGSIPFAYLAGRLLKGKDIREVGDRNPGAGNAYRSIGAKAGLAVCAADIGKAAAAVLIARGLTGHTGAEMMAGVAAVAGHNWPIFLQLRGGRGAASTVGVYMALMPIPAIPLSVATLLLLPVIKSATLALSLIMIPMPLLAWITGASYWLIVYSVALPIMVGIRHYFSSRNPQGREDGQLGGQALPQG